MNAPKRAMLKRPMKTSIRARLGRAVKARKAKFQSAEGARSEADRLHNVAPEKEGAHIISG